MNRLAGLLLPLFLLTACGDSQSDEIVLANAVQARYIDPYKNGDTELWMEVFASDVVAMHDGLPPLEGKDAVRQFADAVSTDFAIPRLDITIDEVRRSGDWAWTRGRFDTVFEAKTDSAPPGVAGERSGKFLLLWERQPSGEWQVIMDMGNSIGPPGPRE